MRPLFGATMFYGAWIHSWGLLAFGVAALATSWFWFPKPKRVPQWVERFIDVEKIYLTPPWTLVKILGYAANLVFVAFTIAAFWERRLAVALGVVVAGCLLKATWSFAVARNAAVGAVIIALVSADLAAILLWLG